MPQLARSERAALCDALDRVGPDAPTLCTGWATRDLAAHIVLRERRPDAQAGLIVRPLSARTQRIQHDLADGDWTALTETIRSGPPRWHPARVPAVAEVLNAAEFFVHHEDVLRAQSGWQPRELGEAEQESLWRLCRTTGKLAARNAPVGVEFVSPDHGRVAVHRGHPSVRVEGAPAELLLFAFGRREVAQVHVDGPSSAVDKLQDSSLGF